MVTNVRTRKDSKNILLYDINPKTDSAPIQIPHVKRFPSLLIKNIMHRIIAKIAEIE